MFSKGPRYYYDWKAIEEPSSPNKPWATSSNGGQKALEIRADGNWQGLGKPADGSRRRRSVWSVTNPGLKLKHFAAYPPRLVEVCIKAGTSLRGCCPKCGAPWRRIVEKIRTTTRPARDSKVVGRNGRLAQAVTGNRDPERHVTQSCTVGWEPGCSCGETATVPCRVLDPFMGAGTTGCVAKRLKRSWVGIELNPKFVAMARQRIDKVQAGMVAL
jgi:hypothetical protein